MIAKHLALAFPLFLFVASCGSATAADGSTPGPVAGDDAAPGDDAALGDDALPSDGGLPPGPDAAGGFTVRRLACVSTAQLAGDLPKNTYGAVDMELVAITPPGSHTSCPTDTGHVHLQLDDSGKRYDVAVNVESTTGAEMAIFTKDLAPTLPPLGYRTATFDFPTNLGAHSGDFSQLAKADLITRIETELAEASRVSIYGHTYTDGTGLHDIHRYGSSKDGVIIVRRGGVGGTDHAIALRFSTDVF
jgi:hypothetical protein